MKNEFQVQIKNIGSVITDANDKNPVMNNESKYEDKSYRLHSSYSKSHPHSPATPTHLQSYPPTPDQSHTYHTQSHTLQLPYPPTTPCYPPTPTTLPDINLTLSHTHHILSHTYHSLSQPTKLPATPVILQAHTIPPTTTQIFQYFVHG